MTNYTNTFIAAADDCPVASGTVPPERTVPTVATLVYQMITGHPYRYTSDEVLFSVFAQRKNLPADQIEEERHRWLSQGQPCLRACPLGKTYGWGIHHDAQSKVALYPLGSEEYRRLNADPSLVQLKAMKSAR